MAVKLLDKKDWTKDGRKWVFYDYVKNLDELEENICQRSFSLKLRL